MNKKTRDEIEKKINQQKFRSVLILEGQEEERKRIAMDVHDGIGQMLTSLKFQIESLDLHDQERLTVKMEEVKNLISQVIKEVRRVTFNLKPTVLGDYGLEAALKLFVTEVGKLTDIAMEFEAKGEATYRLPQKMENNVFRIVQEAVNNSIKYSKAKKIEVVLQWSLEWVTITVKDDGMGFDEKLLRERSNNIESGSGFFNMYERTEYVNGLLDIKSTPGVGTAVILKMPLHSTTLADPATEMV